MVRGAAQVLTGRDGEWESSEAEAGETQNWLRFAVDCPYLPRDVGSQLAAEYDEVISMIVAMRTHPKEWIL